MILEGDRVRIVKGEHRGKTGRVLMVSAVNVVLVVPFGRLGRTVRVRRSSVEEKA